MLKELEQLIKEHEDYIFEFKFKEESFIVTLEKNSYLWKLKMNKIEPDKIKEFFEIKKQKDEIQKKFDEIVYNY